MKINKSAGSLPLLLSTFFSSSAFAYIGPGGGLSDIYQRTTSG